MKVRCERVQTRRETGTRSRKGLKHTRAVCRRAERRDCLPQPRIRACSSRLMNHAGSVREVCGSHHAALIVCIWRINMFVWSKRLVGALLGLFIVMLGIFLFKTAPDNTSNLTNYATGWMTLNYVGLIVWVFVWMIDQARMRGKNFWVWLVPFVLAPLPTLMLFVLFLQRRI